VELKRVQLWQGQGFGSTEAADGGPLPLQRISQDMDALWRMQIIKETGAKRDLWKNKVEQVAEETDALRAGLDRFSGREKR
jgi:hypothetical protein